MRLSPPLARLAWLPLTAASLVMACSPGFALELHVSLDGNDAWSGLPTKPNAQKTDGPVASLAGATAALRKIRSTLRDPEPCRIIVENGLYQLPETWRLGPDDGGTPGCPVSYEAAPGATPVFSGGRIITGWTRGEGGVWRAQIPGVAAGKWRFEQLWVNGRRATRARFPDTSCLPLLGVTEQVLDPAKQPRARQARQTLKLPEDAVATLAALTPEALRDTQIVIYHKWDNTRRFIESVDTPAQTISIVGEGMKPWNRLDAKSIWFAENSRAFLNTAGEWFLGRDGTLEYLPLPGEDMTRAEVVAPHLDQFASIAGDAAKQRPVTDLTIKGLAFRHGQWLTAPGGFEPCQAAATIGAAVEINHAERVLLENCEIGHIGIYGVWFRSGCRDSALRHSHLHDFGAGGVRIGETVMPPDESALTSRIAVDNNIIRQGGRVFPCAVGVWIGFSPDNRVTHNEISHLEYTGISMGWRWGYDASNCKRNTVAFNHVHHIGSGLLSDMGGIYTLGPSEGSLVSDNVFHDIISRDYGGWGLYTDEGSTGITFERNLVYNTRTGGFHQHYGRENILRNNIFVNGRIQQLQATRVESHKSFTLENNIIFWTHAAPALAGPWEKIRHDSSRNLYWNAGSPVTFAGKSLADWQAAGHEIGTVVADPHFHDAGKGDFRVKTDSPAVAIGFKPFDPRNAGVCGDDAWKRLAKEAPRE